MNFRYAFRSLRKSPGFTAAAVLTLALAIGANTAIFSVLEGVVLEPLPFPDPDRLVLVALFNQAMKRPTNLSYPDFLDWQQSSRSFAQIAAFRNQAFDLTSPGAPEHVNGMEISSNFFSTLGTKLALGRELSPAEDTSTGPPAAVISNRLWRERFARSPAALGQTITLSGTNYTIVGILGPGPGFHWGDPEVDIYTALGRWNSLKFASPAAYLNDRTFHNILCVARLHADIGVEQAQAEMNSVQERIAELHPDTERGQGAYVVSLKQMLVGDAGKTLLLLLGAVGLLLLIACANVANLLIARAAGRRREFAVRLALGAGRPHIIRQLVAENLLLSLTGGLAGVLIAKWALDAALVAAPGGIPRVENIGIHTSVLLFVFVVSTAVGIGFGLLPALTVRTDLQSGLQSGFRASAGDRQRTQHVLIVTQIALAVVLLTGGSLLFRTIRNLWAVDPGFDPQHVVVFKVGLSPSVTNTPARIRIAYEQLVERIHHIPGVEAADITALVPLSRAFNEGPFWVGAHPPVSMAEIPRGIYYPTGPDYVRTMGIPLLRGRYLSRADNVQSEPVVLVDSLLAGTYFPNGDAIGSSITVPHWGNKQDAAVRIVGIVGHVEHYDLDGALGEKPQIFYSFYQLPDEIVAAFSQEVTLTVRTPLPVTSVMPALRKAVDEVGRDQPVYNIQTMEEIVARSMGRQRFPAVLLTAFAALALALASVGTYGVISYSTSRRLHEIGIRIALGAERRNVLKMIIGEGLRLAGIGVALGTSAALILAHALPGFSNLLYGIRPTDPLTLIASTVVLMSTAILACYLPARRAARFDPMVALRSE
jgi:predicted permease